MSQLPVRVAVDDYGLFIRTVLRANNDFYVRMTGEYDGTYYRNDFRMSDLDVLMSYESSDLIEITNTFTLDNPTLVLYYRKGITDKGTVDQGALIVEFQLIVNFKPSGYANLRGYSLLLQEFVNPRTRKGLWLGYGLAPRKTEERPVFNGADIDEQLKDRLLIQSQLVTFSLLGVEV